MGRLSMTRALSGLRALVRDERGQDLVEYVLVAALVSVVAIGAMTTAGNTLVDLWDSIAARIDAAL
jgi:Flp pilus assembly pilin Flp